MSGSSPLRSIIYHDLCLIPVLSSVLPLVLWFPVTWLDYFWVFKSSQSQSLYHDLCLDSLENGISGFRLRFTISRSLISRYLAWSCLGLQVLSESEPLSWSLLRFRRERHLGFPFSVYAFLFYDFPLSGLIVSGSSSPLRVRASIMIFA